MKEVIETQLSDEIKNIKVTKLNIGIKDAKKYLFLFIPIKTNYDNRKNESRRSNK